MSIKLPVGIDSFEKLREEDFYYIDKTIFIKELLSTQFEANLVTRPRRFGKTLTMSMLEDFFDIGRDSRAHFAGLEIAGERELCKDWQNKWPVVALTLKSVDGLSFPDAYGMVEVLIANLCKKYHFLSESALVNPADKKLFTELEYQAANKQNVKSSLALLMRMMRSCFGKQVILLVDEYDVPLAKANDNGYYREMLDLIRAMLGEALKSNPDLKFAVITGCLKISKESIFTGLNNVTANTITVERFDESIGFTEKDVRKLLSDTAFPDHAEEMRVWYDGYRFGAVDVYCPWDVLNHVAALQENPAAPPQNYWAATSHNEVIYKLLENPQFDINKKFEILMNGGTIRENITEELTYDSLEASEENLWSLLLMTGYLTQTRVDGTEKLRIPNEEVKAIFQTAIIDWFRQSVQSIDRTAMFQALWEGDAETASVAISDLLFNSISYHDYRESFYHAFLAGLFAGAGYVVESNYEYGNGRPDVIVKDKKKRRVLLFEAKHAGKDETLMQACDKATNQIREKRYAEAFYEGYRSLISYGIAFKGKDCKIVRFQ